MSIPLQLQTRPLRAISISLCATMDLVAIISDDNNMSIYRTLSWERVLSKKGGELTSSGSDDTLSVLSFSLKGKLVAVGCSDGELLIFCLESMDSVSAFRGGGMIPSSKGSSILSLAWQAGVTTTSPYSSSCYLPKSMGISGLNFATRTGMEEYLEPTFGEARESIAIESIFMAEEGSLLLSLAKDGQLCAHVYGIFPLFSVNTCSIGSFPTFCPSSLFCPLSIADGLSLQILKDSNSISAASVSAYDTSYVRPKEYHYFNLKCSDLCIPRNYFWKHHTSTLFLVISSDLSRLLHMISSSSRKWTEASKVIVPKLSLLQGMLDTYQLKFTPIQFLYTVTQCGIWHPAGSTSFTQHWNEQGITRLRSAIDSTSKMIVKQLQLRAIPIATNIALRCRELHSALNDKKDMVLESIGTTNPIFNVYTSALVKSADLLLYKIDETLREAKLAREGLLLYLQFIKDCYTPENQQNASKPNILLREKCRSLFDPRKVRAPHKGPSAQAEYVTGTHLYAFLQDSDLPCPLINARRDDCGLCCLEDIPRKGITPFITALLQQSSFRNPTECIIGESKAFGIHNVMEFEEAFSRRSLIQQIKSTKEALSSAFWYPHDELSQKMENDMNLFISGRRSKILQQVFSIDIKDDCCKCQQICKDAIVSSDGGCITIRTDNNNTQVYPLQSCTIIALLIVPEEATSTDLEVIVCICQHKSDEAITTIKSSHILFASRCSFTCDYEISETFKFGKHSLEIYDKIDLNGEHVFAIIGAGAISTKHCHLFRIPFGSLVFTPLQSKSPNHEHDQSLLNIATIRSHVPLRKDIEIKTSHFVFDSFHEVHTCGARGVALVSSLSKVSIFDLESADDADDDDEVMEMDGDTE